jgi:hypothetical protein
MEKVARKFQPYRAKQLQNNRLSQNQIEHSNVRRKYMNQKIRFFSLCLTAFTTLAFAQNTVAPRATELIEAAKVAHGKPALTTLKGVRATLEMKFFRNGVASTEPQIQTLQIDLIKVRARVDVAIGTKRILSVVVDGNKAKSWTSQSGTADLNGNDTKEIEQQIISSFPVLSLAIPWDYAKDDGKQTWQGVTGEVVSASRKGVKLGLLFDTNNLLIAERLGGKRGDVLALLEDNRIVSGLQIPYKVRLFQAGVLTSESIMTAVSIDPTFVTADFQLP